MSVWTEKDEADFAEVQRLMLEHREFFNAWADAVTS